MRPRGAGAGMGTVRPLAGLAVLALAVAATPAHAAPPADAFCVILVEGIDDFRIVRVTVDLETNLTQREALFEQVDTDGDGTVTPAEQETFQQGTVEVWENATRLGLRGLEMAAGDGAWQWNAPALYATTWTQVGHTFHKQNHTQPSTVTEPADLETQEVREVRFTHQHTPMVVKVSGGTNLTDRPRSPTSTGLSSSYSQTAVIEYVVVRAAPGWLVDSVSGSGYEGEVWVPVNAPEVDLPAFDTKRPFWLDFYRQAAESPPNDGTATVTVREVVTVTGSDVDRGSPALPLALLAAGLAAAALIRRRL